MEKELLMLLAKEGGFTVILIFVWYVSQRQQTKAMLKAQQDIITKQSSEWNHIIQMMKQMGELQQRELREMSERHQRENKELVERYYKYIEQDLQYRSLLTGILAEIKTRFEERKNS